MEYLALALSVVALLGALYGFRRAMTPPEPPPLPPTDPVIGEMARRMMDQISATTHAQTVQTEHLLEVMQSIVEAPYRVTPMTDEEARLADELNPASERYVGEDGVAVDFDPSETDVPEDLLRDLGVGRFHVEPGTREAARAEMMGGLLDDMDPERGP